MKSAHVLELNGKRYDAMTGRLLSKTPHHAASKSVDGFVRPSAQAPALHHHSPRPSAAHRATETVHDRVHAHPVAVPKAIDIARHGIHHARPHQLQHSKTLMRHAVHKPDLSLKRQTKPVVHTGTLVKPVHFDIMPKYSVDNLDEDRLKRAHTIARSKLISRFSETLPSVAPAPAAPQPVITAKPAHTVTAPTLARQPSDDIFERALATANSHKQPFAPVHHRAKKSHRLRNITGIAASSLAVLLIAGFVAYQNAAALQLRVASSRAGINATLPAWQPSGFKLGTFAYEPGTVTVSYKNLTDADSFTITQTASNWDSATLLSDFVYPSNETYDTLSSGGTTIYTYGNNNATWVSGGIWYKLTSNGSLSNSQIVNIATSMQS